MGDSGQWDADLFRREGHRMVEWIAEYLDGGARELPVLAQVEPGDIAKKLPGAMPEQAEDPEVVWQDFIDIILPGVTHWNHPGFMAYFGITGSGPGILGDLMSTALNVNGMLWRTCPSATELELEVLKWLRDGMGLPSDLFGFFCDTASISSLLSLAAAREKADPEIRHQGMTGQRFRVYASDQAHSSIAKACLTLGLGLDSVRSIPHDDDYRMDVAALETAIAEDRAAGLRPLAVVATVGTTSTTSVDPVAEIGVVCRREDLWFHIDAAYAGAAALCPEHQSGSLPAPRPPTAWFSILTSGSSRRLTPRPSTRDTRRSSAVPFRSCPSTSRPPSPARSSTSWTTASSSAAGFARSNCGGSSAASAPKESASASDST